MESTDISNCNEHNNKRRQYYYETDDEETSEPNDYQENTSSNTLEKEGNILITKITQHNSDFT